MFYTVPRKAELASRFPGTVSRKCNQLDTISISVQTSHVKGINSCTLVVFGIYVRRFINFAWEESKLLRVKCRRIRVQTGMLAEINSSPDKIMMSMTFGDIDLSLTDNLIVLPIECREYSSVK